MSQKKKHERGIVAGLVALVTVATRWPILSLMSIAFLVVISGLIVVLGPLEVSTSRQNLVSEDFPYKKRENQFFERFGRPHLMVFVVQGGRAEGRQRLVDNLVQRLQSQPELTGRILGRVGPEQIAEIIFLHEPELLNGLATMLKRHGTTILTGNLVPWLQELQEQIQAGLDGEVEPSPGTSEVDTSAELGQLAELFNFLGDELAYGRSRLPMGRFFSAGISGERRMDEQGYLISPDGNTHFVLLFPRLESDEGAYLAPLVARIRGVRDEVLQSEGFAGMTAELTGEPALAADELSVLNTGLITTSLLSALGILALLYLAFRSVRHTLLALVPLAAGVVITLGFTELIYDGLNLITSSFTSVLMGLGIDFGVHTLHRYSEEQRKGYANSEAMRLALIHAGPGIATGAITTVLAFVTITTTDFNAYAELGVITVIGLIVMLVCTFVLIPPLMQLGARGQETPAPELPGIPSIVVMVNRVPRLILMLALALTVAAIISFLPRGPGYDGRYFDFIPEHTESRRALTTIEATQGMGLVFANLEASSIEEARKLTAKLHALPEVGDVQTATELLPPLDAHRLDTLRKGVARLGEESLATLDSPLKTSMAPKEVIDALTELQDAIDEVVFALKQAGRETAPAVAVSKAIVALKERIAAMPDQGTGALRTFQERFRTILQRSLHTARAVAQRGSYVPNDIPPLFRERFVSKDGKLLALFAYPSGNIWESTFAGRFSKKVMAIDPSASGLAVDIRPYENLIIDGFERASLMAAIFVVLTLLCIYRNFIDTLLAMLPVLLGWGWMLGIMKPLGLAFTAANIVALPLIFGIGLDAGAHMVHRYRESLAAGRQKASLREMVRGTGGAVVVSSLTTMVAFGALMFGGYRAMESMGLLLTTGIGLCLLASVFVLPALLVVLKRAGDDPGDKA